MTDVRVLVVDDSALFRQVLTRLLSAIPGVRVVGTARNGEEAVAKVIELRPDLVTMDVEMPVLDGLAALERIMSTCPTRVLMLSNLTSRGTRQTVQALCLGAVDFVPKPPTQEGLPELAAELGEKVATAMQARIPARHRIVPQCLPRPLRVARARSRQLVVIGASTGGPSALEEVLSRLEPDLPAAVIVVQHLPKAFTASLAQRLDAVCPLPVREAQAREELLSGTVLVAAGGSHLVVRAPGEAEHGQGPARHGVRPAIDVTLETAALHYGADVTAVVLTGMGRDGTAGSRAVRLAGGTVIAQDEASSTVYGMPRAVVRAGLADYVLPLPLIATAIYRLQKGGKPVEFGQETGQSG
jgi:two-component system chemotaxis response regulator CheB